MAPKKRPQRVRASAPSVVSQVRSIGRTITRKPIVSYKTQERFQRRYGGTTAQAMQRTQASRRAAELRPKIRQLAKTVSPIESVEQGAAIASREIGAASGIGGGLLALIKQQGQKLRERDHKALKLFSDPMDEKKISPHTFEKSVEYPGIANRNQKNMYDQKRGVRYIL